MASDDEGRATTSTGQDESDAGEILSRQASETSCYATDHEEEAETNLQLGPKFSIREHLEMDKDDESLRRWKEQLLGSVDVDSAAENPETEVKILTLTILSPGRQPLDLPIPESGDPKGSWFVLKEGSHYSLKFSFRVSNDIVSGLRYTNTVWKSGIKVHVTKEMLGTFSPQAEPYTHEMPEDSAPSGLLFRGSYSARTKFFDDDNKSYLEMNYTFSIQKEWPPD